MEHPSEIERLLESGERGTSELMAHLYTEMRAMASRMMVGERGEHTLQATALVHEAFLRLVGSRNLGRRAGCSSSRPRP